MNYAMILQNRVIGVLENQETKPSWPPDPSGNSVTAIPCDDTVTLDMVYDPETNTFTEYIPPEPETPQPTQLDKIQTAQLTIMAAMADQYEESLEKDLRNMDVQATIYEAILELGGAE